MQDRYSDLIMHIFSPTQYTESIPHITFKEIFPLKPPAFHDHIEQASHLPLSESVVTDTVF